MTTLKFKITNLTCEACVKLSNMALGDIPGAIDISIDQKTGIVNLKSDREIAWTEIESALKTVGKTVEKIK